MKNVSIVLGAGFGDEGKGNFVNYLCKESPDQSIVIRFNGGHQAGHTVVHNGHRHVFSSFGSGTLQYVPTFWSKYCTVYPTGFLREREKLIDAGVQPVIYIDPMCPVTTPFDVTENRLIEQEQEHGSCGVGFGQTILRHETLDHSHRIFAKDLKNPWILRHKLMELAAYYGRKSDLIVDNFMEDCRDFLQCIKFGTEQDTLAKYGHLIFEGAQGILLDREHGMFPHVTRSHTTSKNAMEIIRRCGESRIDVYYMTRCYSTRHGNGPFFDVSAQPDNEHETNVSNNWQGDFRIAPFSPANLRYAIDSDSVYISDKWWVNKHTVITCMDHFTDDIPVLSDNFETIHLFSKESFKNLFPIDTIFVDRPDY